MGLPSCSPTRRSFCGGSRSPCAIEINREAGRRGDRYGEGYDAWHRYTARTQLFVRGTEQKVVAWGASKESSRLTSCVEAIGLPTKDRSAYLLC